MSCAKMSCAESRYNRKWGTKQLYKAITHILYLTRIIYGTKWPFCADVPIRNYSPAHCAKYNATKRACSHELPVLSVPHTMQRSADGQKGQVHVVRRASKLCRLHGGRALGRLFSCRRLIIVAGRLERRRSRTVEYLGMEHAPL